MGEDRPQIGGALDRSHRWRTAGLTLAWVVVFFVAGVPGYALIVTVVLAFEQYALGIDTNSGGGEIFAGATVAVPLGAAVIVALVVGGLSLQRRMGLRWWWRVLYWAVGIVLFIAPTYLRETVPWLHIL